MMGRDASTLRSSSNFANSYDRDARQRPSRLIVLLRVYDCKHFLKLSASHVTDSASSLNPPLAVPSRPPFVSQRPDSSSLQQTCPMLAKIERKPRRHNVFSSPTRAK